MNISYMGDEIDIEKYRTIGKTYLSNNHKHLILIPMLTKCIEIENKIEIKPISKKSIQEMKKDSLGNSFLELRNKYINNGYIDTINKENYIHEYYDIINKYYNIGTEVVKNLTIYSESNDYEYFLAYQEFPENCLVFVDPDTGIQPENVINEKHLKYQAIRMIMNKLTQNSTLIIYQHEQKNRKNWYTRENRLSLLKQNLENIADDNIKIENNNDSSYLFIIKK